MQVIHRPIPPKIHLVIVMKETDEGWMATCNNIPTLLFVGKDYETIRQKALHYAKSKMPHERFKTWRIPRQRQLPYKLPVQQEGHYKEGKPLIQRAKERLHGKYHTREIDGVERYVIDGKFLTIPQFIAAAGFRV